MSNLDRHVKSDKVKWVITAIAFVLAFVMIVGVAMQVFMPEGKRPTDWFEKTEDTQQVTEDSGVVTPLQGNGVKLMSARIMSENYAEYGVSPLAEDAFSLTATITPAEATYKDVEWSIAFENPSSSWAQGKTVTDYASLSETTALTNSLSINKAFGESIIVKVTSLDNPDAYATCKVDYIKRISNFQLTWYDGSTSITEAAGSYVDENPVVDIQYSDGTIDPVITYSATWETADLVGTYNDVSRQLGNVHYTCQHDSSGSYSLDFNYEKQQIDDAELKVLFADESSLTAWDLDGIIRTECDCRFSSLSQSVQNQVKSILYNSLKDSPILVGTFKLTYTAKYGDKTVSSGTKTLTQYLDFSDLSVPVSNIQMNQTNIYV